MNNQKNGFLNKEEIQILPIPSYVFKVCRRQREWTLKKASYELDIEPSYLNKIENDRVDLPSHILRGLLRLYELDERQLEYCDFDTDFIKFYIYKITSSMMSEDNVIYLKAKRERYTGSGYAIYLVLLLFAYKSYRQEYDEEFYQDLKDLEKLIHALPDFFQYFFYTFALHYTIRTQEMELYHKYSILLNNYHFHFLDGINAYSDILYVLFIGKTDQLLRSIEYCQEKLELYPNTKIENALIFIQARYYRNLQNYEKAIELYEMYAMICKQEGDLSNYGIVQNSIGWIYNLQKKYDIAITHYLEAEPYMNYGDFYFDLAWCYYCLNDDQMTLRYTKKGKEAIIDHKKWSLFLEWLECMATYAYGKRCKQKLDQLYHSYFDDLTGHMKSFLLVCLINQAKHDGMLELENQYLIELVNMNVLINHSILSKKS